VVLKVHFGGGDSNVLVKFEGTDSTWTHTIAFTGQADFDNKVDVH
jgi:hypothetical protein